MVAAATAAAVFLAAHVGRLATAPDSIDATNFVLGVRDFDVAKHQPHPPGYPVYVALGRIAHDVISYGNGATTRIVAEARALSWLGVTFGALAVFPLAWLFRRLDRPLPLPYLAVAAGTLVLACPLFWFSAARPMSDVPGLALTVLAQATLVSAIARLWPLDSADPTQPDIGPATWRLMAAGGLCAGVALGVRVQTVLLTLPLLLVAVWLLGQRSGRWLRACLVSGGTVAAGALVWLGPLAFSGSYLDALTEQATDDFTGGYMLALHPSPRAIVRALETTFVAPWGHVGLGAVVLSLAVAGFVRMWRTGPRRLALIVVAAAPYGAFHLLFQDTSYPRYALPVVPAVVWLAANGLAMVAGRGAPFLALSMAVGGAIVAAEPTREHFRVGSPAVRALTDLREQLPAAGPPKMAMHREVWQALRLESLPAALGEPAQGYEWLTAAEHWARGDRSPIWFLANRRRTDLAFMDPDGQRLIRSYAWTYDRRPYLGEARPGGVDWYELTPPSWFVTRGWSLTPEMAGIAALERQASVEPLVAYVRRREAPALMAIGGRIVSGVTPTTRVHVTLDDRPLASLAPAPDGTFLDITAVPKALLAGSSRYARLTVEATSDEQRRARLPLAVEQFEVQSPGGWLLAFDAGWHQAEYEFERAEMWRWTARRASLRLATFGRSVVLRLNGMLPDLDAGGTNLDVRVGSRRVARFYLLGEFDIDVPIDGRELEAAGGVVWLESGRSWVPAETGESADRRELALRIVDVEVRPGDAGPAHAWLPTRERHPYR